MTLLGLWSYLFYPPSRLKFQWQHYSTKLDASVRVSIILSMSHPLSNVTVHPYHFHSLSVFTACHDVSSALGGKLGGIIQWIERPASNRSVQFSVQFSLPQVSMSKCKILNP